MFSGKRHNVKRHNAKRHNAKRHNASRHYANRHNTKMHDANRHNAKGQNANRHSAKRHNAKRHKANRHNAKSQFNTNRVEPSCVLCGQILSALKGRRLIVQVKRKHNHFRKHFLPDVIVITNSPQILSQDILRGRMFRPLKHHLLRVLTKTYEGSCCSTFAHAQFLHMATDYFA